MKKLILMTAIVFGFLTSIASAKTIYHKGININVFYSSLEPYGEWIEIGYDDFVWRPYKSDYNWRPYADGRWEWTRNGWYWVSYEPFGWATYHYGRWYYDDYYGWVWMPDNIWAPAWVEWRYNENYIGWAPLPPYAKFSQRRGIYFSISWHSGYRYWNFVKYKHFTSYNIHQHCVSNTYVKNVYIKTKHRTNYFAENDRIVNGGVSRRFVERKIGRKLYTKEIRKTKRFNDYDSNVRKQRSKDIFEYSPSERDLNVKSFDKSKVKKGRALKSLKTDKIALNRKNNNRYEEHNKSSEKNVRKKISKRNSNKSIQKKSYKKNKNNDFSKIEKKSNSQKKYKRTSSKSEKESKLNSRLKKKKSGKSVKKGNKNYSKKKSSSKSASNRQKLKG